MTFEREKIALDIMECNKCGLGSKVLNKVISRGTSDNPDIVFIGEAPGSEEDKTGTPFVGRSGKVLDDMIHYMRIKDYVIINRLKCHPPGNANPTPGQLQACHPFLLRQIEFYNPKIIILLGRYANNNFGPPLEWGEIEEYDGIYYCKVYHPAALLHHAKNKIPQAKYMDNIIELLEVLETKQ